MAACRRASATSTSSTPGGKHDARREERRSVGRGYTANIRFADNRISTAGGVSTATLNIQSAFGPKHAVVTTNDFTDAGLERAVRQSEALAKLAPDDPEAMPPLEPQQYQNVKT